MLYGAIAFIAVLGALLITVLSFWNARPIREILFLTERLVPEDSRNPDEAGMDRMRAILMQLYASRQEKGTPAAGEPEPEYGIPVMPESPDADLLLTPDENPLPSAGMEHLSEYDLVRQVMAFIELHQDESILNVSMLADRFGMEISNLSHQFKNRTGYALSDYLNARKLDVACTKLRSTRMSVASIAESLGYSHASSFIRMFKRVYGITPTQFRGEAQADPLPESESDEES